MSKLSFQYCAIKNNQKLSNIIKICNIRFKILPKIKHSNNSQRLKDFPKCWHFTKSGLTDLPSKNILAQKLIFHEKINLLEIERIKVGDDQCDLMDKLFAQYLAIYNHENLPNSIKIAKNKVKNYRIGNKPSKKIPYSFKSCPKLFFWQIWSHCRRLIKLVKRR